MPAGNECFGATAAGCANLKGSAGMSPLRQAAIPLSASGGHSVVDKVARLENGVHPDNEVVMRKLNIHEYGQIKIIF